MKHPHQNLFIYLATISTLILVSVLTPTGVTIPGLAVGLMAWFAN